MLPEIYKKVHTAVWALFICSLSFAQPIIKNFENSDLNDWIQNNSERWNIDTIDPITGKGSLHQYFNNTTAGTDMIVLSHHTLLLDSVDAYWEFAIKYNYSPSSSNNWSCWLINSAGDEEPIPATESTGYVFGVNYQGSDDFIKLWKKDKSGTEVVLATPFNWQLNISAGECAKLKLLRTKQGSWSVAVDTIMDGSWINLGSVSDLSFREINNFGLYYKYSSTQDRKLWFDDLEIDGYFFTDIIPPGIDSVRVIDRNTLEVNFNEPIDTAKAIGVILNGLSQTIQVNWVNSKACELIFPGIFAESNTMELINVTDLEGNCSASLTTNFQYYHPQKFDLIISEIFADPTPQVGLPECEYIEIFNRSGFPIDIENWNLRIGENSVVLPKKLVMPGKYYLVGKSSCTGEFESGINKIPVTGFPSLINTGFLLELNDKYGQLIHALDYSDEWFTDESKKEGGWSIEMIDSQQPCLGKANWIESISSKGGTPGAENSVNTSNQNIAQAAIKSLQLIDANTILISFSENMDSSSMANASNYSIEPGNLHPDSIFTEPPFFKNAELSFRNNFSQGIKYKLSVTENSIFDCAGYPATASELYFGIPEPCDSADIIINEILFESTDFVPEFIELYNNSTKIIDLQNFNLNTLDEYSDAIKNSIILSNAQLLFYPGEYIVFTEDKEELVFSNSVADADRVFKPGSWMSFSNEGGKLCLKDAGGKTIDLSIFNKGMHFSLLSETAGISLERLAPEKQGDKPQSWHSASEEAGFATPTKQNSQTILEINGVTVFTIEPKEFSPDNDGLDDFMTINYSFEVPGYMLSVSIFDITGSLVVELANNEFCSTKGSIVWDGLSKNKVKLPMGYYIVFAEAFHPDGDIVKLKEAVLLLPTKK